MAPTDEQKIGQKPQGGNLSPRRALPTGSLTVRRYEGTTALPRAYSSLFDQAAGDSFFLSLLWFENFERTIVAPVEKVCIYGVEDVHSAAPLAALVMYYTSIDRKLFRVATLSSLANYYTSYFGLVVARDYEADIEIPCVLAAALWQDHSRWHVLDLRPLDGDSLLFRALVSALRSVGMPVQTHFCFGNWYLLVQGRSYAEYIASLPKVLRKNIPYTNRRLERDYRVRTIITTDSNGLEQALDDYEKIYNTSWRVPEPYPEFIRRLARTAAEKGLLRLGLIYLNDEPAAAQLWLVHGQVASIYKICYAEKFARLSVGTALTGYLFQHVIDIDRVQEVDYLSGDDEYKKNWMSHRRERWGIMAFNAYSLPGLLLAVRHIGGRAVKRMLWRVSGQMKTSAAKAPDVRSLAV